MPLRISEFLKQFMIDTFLLKSTQFEKTSSMVIFLFRWEIWKLNSTFETRSRSQLLWPFFLRCSKVEFAFLLAKEMKSELNQKFSCTWVTLNYLHSENYEPVTKSTIYEQISIDRNNSQRALRPSIFFTAETTLFSLKKLLHKKQPARLIQEPSPHSSAP